VSIASIADHSAPECEGPFKFYQSYVDGQARLRDEGPIHDLLGI